MCGIAGFVTARPAPAAELETLLRRMIAPLRHRGPDDEGVWSDGRGGLAHARLAIIDLSPAAHQPMASSDRSVWIAYNGEVYNFRELRAELETRGYRFNSRSDTEVVVNGWHAWGPQLFSRLRGMFALALWDRRNRRLVLARDRVGEKPLHWTLTPSGLAFASEIKALQAWREPPRAPDREAIDCFLSLQYVPAPLTAFAGVNKLAPAHYLSLQVAADGSLAAPALTRYWDLPAADRRAARTDPRELRRELAERVAEAVRLRLVADVPLGAFLSGGVDSSAVVAMMARAGGGRVKTFSIGFADRDYDETRYARMVAARYGTDHHELVVEPDAVAILPRLVWHYGEPFADPSAIPTWYVAEMARRELTVALSGDGGDECFLGYRRYRAMWLLAGLDRLPAQSRELAAHALAAAPRGWQRRLRLKQIRDVVAAPAAAPATRYLPLVAFFSDEDKAAGYGEAMQAFLASSVSARLAPDFAGAGGLVDGANRADIRTYLADDLMVKVDIAAMAHGLEVRAPLLDHRLMEWATALPPALRMRRGALKGLFKSAMAPFLPRAVLRRGKRGFGCPIDRWFRGPLKAMAYDILLSQAARERGLFRADYVRQLLDQHSARMADHQNRLWALLMLELWFRMWIDRPADTAEARPAA